MDCFQLSPVQLDALREVGNIGVGNAITALSQLVGKKIDITVPSVNIVAFNDIMFSENVEREYAGIVVRVLGDTPGNILFMLEKNTSLEIISGLLGETQTEITDMGESVLCEIGNIISTSYMNAIAKFTNLFLMPSVPAIACDMFSAILSTTFIEAGQYNEHVLDIETIFLQENTKMEGHFYYIPMPGSLEKILNSLGVN